MAATGLRILISAWLVAVAAWDRAERRIPNALVLPVLGAVLAWRLYQAVSQRTLTYLWWMLLAWGVIVALWALHWWGGGDAKFLMVLFGTFPTAEFTLLLALAIVLCEAPRWWIRRRRGSTPRQNPPLTSSLGNWLPSAQALRTHGHADAWMLALAGLVYVWWLF